MRTLQELVNTDEPGWTIVKEWISLAKNKVEILPCERQRAEKALENTQVTTRSLLGAIIYETGGLLIDGGWIRILGSGCDQMQRTISDWNRGKTFTRLGETPPYLLIADDVVGGFYAINAGFLGKDIGNVYYFVPESLEWMSMEIDYSAFLLFCFETDMDDFYEGMRWDGWREDVESLHSDYAYSFYPSLWTEEGGDINRLQRMTIPVEEVYNLSMESRNTLGKSI